MNPHQGGFSLAYFEWAEDMVIDNGPIDADHRHLVDLVNAPHIRRSDQELLAYMRKKTHGCGAPDRGRSVSLIQRKTLFLSGP